MAASHVEQLLIGGLLASQPNSSALAPAPAADITARSTRVAVDLIEARPEHPWRVAELAACVGVSSRTLQEGFRRDRGCSPMDELRRVRMDRAHADLVAGEPHQVGVSTIASRWGFHLSPFAQAYRDRYGELPSRTLAR